MLPVLLVLALSSCDAYMTGAPEAMCNAPRARPYHNDTLPQWTGPPYMVEVNSTIYTPGEPINITIHGNGNVFRGFLLMSDTTSGVFNGIVANVTSNTKNVGNCGMTHTSGEPKTAVTFLWTPPPTVHLGNVQFVAAVVYNFTTFWDNIRSPVIKPNLYVYKSYEEVFSQMVQTQSSAHSQAVGGQQTGSLAGHGSRRTTDMNRMQGVGSRRF